MRRSYEYLLVEARGVDARLWLLDIRRRNKEDPQTAQWQLDEFLPQLTSHFGGPSFLAYLLSAAQLARVDNQMMNLTHLVQLPRSVHVALFTEEGTANEWRRQQEPASPEQK